MSFHKIDIYPDLSLTIKRLMVGDEAPYVHRHGQHGEFFKIIGNEGIVEVPDLRMALLIEKLFLGHKSRSSSCSRKQGWFALCTSTNKFWGKLPVLKEGEILDPNNGELIRSFNGCCVVRSSLRDKCVMYTWLDGVRRHWRVASVQELSVELRRSY